METGSNLRNVSFSSNDLLNSACRFQPVLSNEILSKRLTKVSSDEQRNLYCVRVANFAVIFNPFAEINNHDIVLMSLGNEIIWGRLNLRGDQGAANNANRCFDVLGKVHSIYRITEPGKGVGNVN